MLIVMAISIFTVRIVLQNLGVTDYGIYNVVGGLSSAFIFFQSALTNATQRFLNFELGTKNVVKLNNIFNLSLELYFIIAVLVLTFGSTIGIWFIYNKLSIPTDKINAACLVLITTLISLAFSFISSVFDAVIISRENMKIYAYLGLIDAVSKLIIAYVIVIVPSNKLSVYAILLMIFSIITKLATIIYSKNHYEETKLKFYWNRDLFKEIFSFSGWNLYGTAVWMVNQQGINILLNIFYGPIINAARGITAQVTNVVNNFIVNFFTAIRPQIIKSYASENLKEFISLILDSTKFSVLLVWIICLPLILKIDYILSIWLETVPEYTSCFIKWVIVFILVDTFNNPLWSGIQATGKLKTPILYGSTVFLLAFPISYILLRYLNIPWIVYPVLIILRAFNFIIWIYILRKYVEIKFSLYLKNVILPISLIVFISFVSVGYINNYFPNDFKSLIIISLISVLINTLCMYSIGLNPSQKSALNSKINDIFKKIKKN